MRRNMGRQKLAIYSYYMRPKSDWLLLQLCFDRAAEISQQASAHRSVSGSGMPPKYYSVVSIRMITRIYSHSTLVLRAKLLRSQMTFKT